MVLTAYPALSPATNSSCHRRQRIKVLPARSGSRTSADLTPATGARTTRFCRPRIAPFVLRDPDRSRAKTRPAINSARRAAASTATRPNVRDDGQRPSYRNGIAKATTVSGFRKAFFGVGTGHPNQLELPREIDFRAHAIWRARRAARTKVQPICPGPRANQVHFCISLLPLGRAVGRLKFSEN